MALSTPPALVNRPQISAKDLRRRYRNGERNFAGVDLSGESLRGLNLRKINLKGADLSKTDLRGTNFTEAVLIEAQFIEAKTGTQRRWLTLKLLIAFVLAALASFLVSEIWSVFADSIINPNDDITRFGARDIFFGISGIYLSLGLLGFIYVRGILTAVGIALISVAFVSALGIAFTNADAFSDSDVVTGAVAGSVAFAGSVAIAIAIATATATAGSVAGSAAIAGSAAFAIAVAITGAGGNLTAIGIITAGTLSNILISSLIARRALSGDPRDGLIRNIAVWLGSWGGTQFVAADLTDATFSKANLKSSHFYGANLNCTCFHLSKNLNLARLGNTILADFKVQNLLVTLRGKGQSYIGLNLQGANLAGADLADADFTESDLSQATLEGAALERAKLLKTQALGTQFRQANFTGACLEAWNIDSTTRLEGAICDYAYLLNNQQERRPNSGIFQPGEFTKLFEEVLDTIDLIFQNGIDWKAFIRTFGQIQVQYGDAELSVQSIENKGDSVVVVRLNAAPDADKSAIHQSFQEVYQVALKEAEGFYKAQLEAKDEQIADYRQQSANMQEVVKLLANRPINVTAISESKAMQGNDNSRNISVTGNVTGSALQTGDHNNASIQFQQASLPRPESVNIRAELAALTAILASLNDPITSGVAEKLEVEAAKPNPDKSVISTTLETGLNYARNLQGFAEAIDKLKPHVQNAAAWLGEHGYKLLPLVGLAL